MTPRRAYPNSLFPFAAAHSQQHRLPGPSPCQPVTPYICLYHAQSPVWAMRAPRNGMRSPALSLRQLFAGHSRPRWSWVGHVPDKSDSRDHRSTECRASIEQRPAQPQLQRSDLETALSQSRSCRVPFSTMAVSKYILFRRVVGAESTHKERHSQGPLTSHPTRCPHERKSS